MEAPPVSIDELLGLALERGATTAAAFVRARLGAGPRESARLVRLATDVAGEPAARTAPATGEITGEHAQVIVRTLGGLPASVPADVRGRAEALLLEWAHTFDAEDRAYAKRGLWLSEMGEGFILRAELDHEVGAGLQAMIAACSRPQRTSDGERDPRSAPQRRADGLEHILRLAAASGQLPSTAGNVQVWS